jgi:Sulfotransferase family
MTTAFHHDPVPRDDLGAIRDPLLIVGAPRSGTSMLFQALSTHPDLWSLYRESQEVIEKTMAAALEARNSDVLRPEDLQAGDADRLSRAFYYRVGNAEAVGAISSRLPLILRAKLNKVLTSDRNGSKPAMLRIVEKNPQNSFRLEFLNSVFPDARFVVITRAPASNLASIYRGWDESRFRTHRLPVDFVISDHRTKHWCFGRPPGWQDRNGFSLIDICAFQWCAYNEAWLKAVPFLTAPVLRVTYEELCERPCDVLTEIAKWADLDPKPLSRFANGLPVVNSWSRPRPDKWRTVAPLIAAVAPVVSDIAAELGYVLP